METCLRYSGQQKQLCLHAKEEFFIDSNFFFQIHGKLNTRTGEASGIAKLKRRFYPELFTSLDAGVKYDTEMREFICDLQGKKTIPITDNGLLSVDMKGGYSFNPSSQKGKQRGIVELTYRIFNFSEDQDVRLRIGYNLFDKKPYFQIRENNWTVNADINGRWNVKYDL